MQTERFEMYGLSDSRILIKDCLTSSYYRMGFPEAGYFIEYLKESGIPAECALIEENESGNLQELLRNAEELSPEKKAFLRKSFDASFAEGSADRQSAKKGIVFYSPARIQLFKLDPASVISRIPMSLCRIFSAEGIIVILCVSAILWIIGCMNSQSIIKNAELFTPGVSEIVVLILLSLLSLLFHELAHAMSCRFYGGNIPWMGMTLYFFIPCPFCDVSDIYRMRERKKGLSVSLAGIAANLLAGDLALAVYLSFLSRGLSLTVLLYFWLLNLLTAVFNFLPFIKLDGYWMLTCVTGIHNLMDTALKSLFIRPEMHRAKAVFSFIYGLIVMIFRPVFWIFTIFSIYTLLDPPVVHRIWRVVITGAAAAAALTDEILFLIRFNGKKKSDKERRSESG